MFRTIVLCLLLSSCYSVSEQMTITQTGPAFFESVNREKMLSMSRRAVKVEQVCGMDHMGLMGSGVVVGHADGKTIVATAAHVTDAILEEGCDIVVSDWRGFSGFGHVLESDNETDVSTIEVGETVGIAAGLFKEPYLGQPVTCVGWPSLPHRNYDGESITRGYVSTVGVSGFIRISADLYFGNSGGSCFSDGGEVVGIVSHFMVGGSFWGTVVPHPGQYFISHVDNLKKLLD